MKLTYKSIVFLCVTLLIADRTVQGAFVYGEYYPVQNGPIHLGHHIDNNTNCDGANAIAAFHNNGKICVDNPIWNKDLKAQLPNLVDVAPNVAHWQDLALYLSGYKGLRDNQEQGGYISRTFPLYAKKMLSLLNDRALGLLPNDGYVRAFVVHLMPYMSSTQIDRLDSNLVAGILQNIQANQSALFGTLVSRFSDRALKDHINSIVQAVQTTNVHLSKLEPKVLKALFNSEEFCQQANFGQIMTLASRKAQANLLPASCMKDVIANMGNNDCNLRIRYFDPHSFQLVDSFMTDNCYSYLTKSHIEGWGSRLENREERCRALLIERLSFEAISSVDSACLAARYGNQDRPNANDPIQLSSKWTKMKDDILSSFRGNQALIERIHNTDWAYISVAQKQVLASDTKSQELLPPNFFYYNGEVTLTKEAFEQLPVESKGPALRFAKLPDDVLANVTSMADWRCYPKTIGEDVVEGLAILDLIANQPNAGKIIENLSAKVIDEHACRDVATVAQLSNLKALQEYGSLACFDSIGEKIEPQHLGDLDPRIGQLLPMDVMVRSMDERKWADLDCKALLGLLSATGYCKEMSAGKWNNIRDDCISQLDAKCVSQIGCWDEINNKFINELKPEAFRLSTKTTTPSESRLSDEQIGELGAEVSDLSLHPASDWKAETLSRMSQNRWGKIGARAFAACPPEAYSAIDEEVIIKAISPKAMVGMRLDQVKEIKPKAIAGLTQDQAHQISKEVSGDQCAVCWLSEQPVSDPVKKILKDRCSGAKPKTAASPQAN